VPPLQCDVPVDINAIIPANNAGLLNQIGFVNLQLNETNVTGVVLNDPLSGYRFQVVGGSTSFNNVYQNTFPATPNNLLYILIFFFFLFFGKN
jgi:hypothetical protein